MANFTAKIFARWDTNDVTEISKKGFSTRNQRKTGQFRLKVSLSTRKSIILMKKIRFNNQ